jgi:hypothetical protein
MKQLIASLSLLLMSTPASAGSTFDRAACSTLASEFEQNASLREQLIRQAPHIPNGFSADRAWYVVGSYQNRKMVEQAACGIWRDLREQGLTTISSFQVNEHQEGYQALIALK